MEDTMECQDDWELKKAIAMSLEQDSYEEADIPLHITEILDTVEFSDEPDDSDGFPAKSGYSSIDYSSSDDSDIEEHPSEIPLDELEVVVRYLDLASAKLDGYEEVSPLIFWLQGFGRGNPTHEHFKRLCVNKLAAYAHGRKINTALEVLKSDTPNRRGRAIVAIQKHHADCMIDKVLKTLMDATPEEYDLYDRGDHQKASRRIGQWLKWQRRAARLECLPSGGHLSQGFLSLDQSMHDRLDEDDPATFRQRYELHASQPQSTPTEGDLVWVPGGSLTYPVNDLRYLYSENGIPVRLPAMTRVWDAEENRTKLTRRMPDYAMLFTPEKDGDGQAYLDQSRHRRGAVAVPKPLPQVPVFDQTTNTWPRTTPPSAPRTSENAQTRPAPSSVRGIIAPSMYPATLQEELKKMRQTSPPRNSPLDQHAHDVWGLPLDSLNKRRLDQIAPESRPATKRARRVTSPKRIDPSVTYEIDPDDPSWSHPSPKNGPGAPRFSTLTLAEQLRAKVEALRTMHLWQWPEKHPNESRSQPSSVEDEDEEDKPTVGEDDGGDEKKMKRRSTTAKGRTATAGMRCQGTAETIARRTTGVPLKQFQEPAPNTDNDSSKPSGDKLSRACQDRAASSRHSISDTEGDPSKDHGTCQDSTSSLQPSAIPPRDSRMPGLRGGGNTSGGMFGNTNSTTAPTTLGSHSVSKPTATQASGGLFGNSTTASSAPGTGTPLFGNGLGNPQASAATTTTSSNVFGGGLGLGGSKPGLFGNNPTTTTQPSTTSAGGGGGIFGGTTMTNQQTNTGSGLFGGATQTSQTQQTVPAVRIDASNIKSTTRFSELHEDIQQQILAIDEVIQASIEKSLQCSQVLPQLGASVETLPGDVELLETRLETVDGALSRDAQDVSASKEVVNADALDALKVFRAVENLKLPAQFHYSSIGGGFNSGSGAGDEEGSTDLLPYFHKTVNRLEKEINEYQRVVVEVESHLRTVEGSAIEGIQKVVRRRQMMRASNGQNGVNTQIDARKEGLRELAGTMRGFEEAVLRVAGRVGEAREGVVELGLGISRR